MNYKPFLTAIAFSPLLLPLAGCNQADTPETTGDVDYEANRPVYDEAEYDETETYNSDPLQRPDTDTSAAANDTQWSDDERANAEQSRQATAPQPAAEPSTDDATADGSQPDAEDSQSADSAAGENFESQQGSQAGDEDVVEKQADQIPEGAQNEDESGSSNQ